MGAGKAPITILFKHNVYVLFHGSSLVRGLILGLKSPTIITTIKNIKPLHAKIMVVIRPPNVNKATAAPKISIATIPEAMPFIHLISHNIMIN